MVRLAFACLATGVVLAQSSAIPAAADAWQHFGTPYFRTNESLLNDVYPRLDNLGGVMVGVGFQQNFSILVHGRPDLYVILDINPGVTEVLVPFFGKLMERSRSRREFLSLLLSVPLTESEMLMLLEPKRANGASADDLKAHLARAAGALLAEHGTTRAHRLAELEALLDSEVLSRHHAAHTHAKEIHQWFRFLDEEYLSGEFFYESALASWQTTGSGWLSTEPGYHYVREAWLAHRILTVTGDISGPAVARLARWLRETNPSVPVTAIYVSNIGMSVAGHENAPYFASLYATLSQLPLSPSAWVLTAQGPRLTAFLRPFQQAANMYQRLGDTSGEVMARLIELPLERAVRGTSADAIATLRIELRRMLDKRDRSTSAQQAALYDKLLDGAAPGSITGLSTSTDLYRAVEATRDALVNIQRERQNLHHAALAQGTQRHALQ